MDAAVVVEWNMLHKIQKSTSITSQIFVSFLLIHHVTHSVVFVLTMARSRSVRVCCCGSL